MLTEPLKSVAHRTRLRNAEVAWFDDLCGGDTQYLGVLDEKRRSNYEHCRNIMLAAEQMGFSNIVRTVWKSCFATPVNGQIINGSGTYTCIRACDSLDHGSTAVG